MKKRKEIKIIENITTSIVCDCCGKEYEDIMDLQEFLSMDMDAGYNSAFPDGRQLELDLCSKCVKKLLGKYIRVDGKKGIKK